MQLEAVVIGFPAAAAQLCRLSPGGMTMFGATDHALHPVSAEVLCVMQCELSLEAMRRGFKPRAETRVR